jgi:hypothetical protein
MSRSARSADDASRDPIGLGRRDDHDLRLQNYGGSLLVVSIRGLPGATETMPPLARASRR